MKIYKTIVVVTLIISLFGFSTKVIADPLEIVKPESLSISGQINYYSELYDVDSDTITKVIQCESSFNPNAHNSNGEDSWGLVQINLLAHRSITIEQATDTNFAIDFLAKNLKAGKGNMWSCYRKL